MQPLYDVYEIKETGIRGKVLNGNRIPANAIRIHTAVSSQEATALIKGEVPQYQRAAIK